MQDGAPLIRNRYYGRFIQGILIIGYFIQALLQLQGTFNYFCFNLVQWVSSFSAFLRWVISRAMA